MPMLIGRNESNSVSMIANKNNILITTSSFNADLNCLSQFNVIKNPYKRKLNEGEVIRLIEEFRPVGMIAGVEPLSEKVLETGIPELMVISRCGTGLDNVDMKTAARLSIRVTNTPDAPSQAVAELSIALMLNLLRNISITDKEIRGGKWNKAMGNLLSKQTVGIIGCGRIGTRVAMLCNGFGANVIGYDPNGLLYNGITGHTLEELFREADIISLHVPYRDELRYFINKDVIAKMKPGAILINTSRGGLVDEDALGKALEAGRIRGAGLDTFEEEPYSGNLCKLPNVILTAHIGSYAQEARSMMEQEAVENLIRILMEEK